MSEITVSTRVQGMVPHTVEQAMSMAQTLAKSTMVPKQYQGKPDDVFVAVSWGLELGLAPLQALQNIACINGKPSVYGDAAMALVQASPVCEDIEEYFEGEGTPNPVAVCIAHRKGRKPVTAKFSVEDAKRAGLWNKTGPWQAYPKRMMQMRARGFALRDAFPDVLKGLITVEEAQDYPHDEKDVTPKAPVRNPLDALAPPKPPEIELPPPDMTELDVVNVEIAEAMPEPETVSMVVDSSELKEVTPATSEGDWVLHIPGKEPSVFPDYPMWSEAYETLADKVTNAGKLTARARMTKLRELREANEDMMQNVPTVERVNHTAAYSKRLNFLGAKLKEAEGTE